MSLFTAQLTALAGRRPERTDRASLLARLVRTGSLLSLSAMPLSRSRLSLIAPSAPVRAISPHLEMGAYEVLWAGKGATPKRNADLFHDQADALPSDLVPKEEPREVAERVRGLLRRKGVDWFGLVVRGSTPSSVHYTSSVTRVNKSETSE